MVFEKGCRTYIDAPVREKGERTLSRMGQAIPSDLSSLLNPELVRVRGTLRVLQIRLDLGAGRRRLVRNDM